MFYSNLIKGTIKYKTFDLLPFDNQMNTKDDRKIKKLGTCKMYITLIVLAGH